IGLTEGRLKIGQYLFLRHGGKIVFFGRFLALLRTFAALLAGANRMEWLHFLAMNAAGGILWAVIFGGGAYLFGDRLEAVSGPISIGVLVAVVVGCVIGFFLIKRYERDLEKHARQALAEHEKGLGRMPAHHS
ncbi:MAG TPA: VTT domain-containing protein, partial [Pararhizobium sp.]|nr:VTT domain-containing protein [Pararhizobium sp.]